jgi:hypothetical protein
MSLRGKEFLLIFIPQTGHNQFSVCRCVRSPSASPVFPLFLNCVPDLTTKNMITLLPKYYRLFKNYKVFRIIDPVVMM